MKTAAHTTTAERAGRWLGRAWRGYVRRERLAAGWLVARGMPAGVATVAIWVMKLAVLGALLFSAFWLALLLTFAFAAAWTARNTDWDEEQETEWKTGAAGFGLYRGDVRIDIGDANDDA